MPETEQHLGPFGILFIYKGEPGSNVDKSYWKKDSERICSRMKEAFEKQDFKVFDIDNQKDLKRRL